MTILISILTALASCFNYAWWLYGEPIQALSIAVQIVLVLLTITAAAIYPKTRLRPAYELGMPRVFTFGFAIIVLSLFANIGILIAVLMLMQGT
jgi:hypothetical protein